MVSSNVYVEIPYLPSQLFKTRKTFIYFFFFFLTTSLIGYLIPKATYKDSKDRLCNYYFQHKLTSAIATKISSTSQVIIFTCNKNRGPVKCLPLEISLFTDGVSFVSK